MKQTLKTKDKGVTFMDAVLAGICTYVALCGLVSFVFWEFTLFQFGIVNRFLMMISFMIFTAILMEIKR
jgi:hypothetical protein